jgi:hypothetical protein
MKTLALSLAILSSLALVGTAFAQEGNVINSKYLTIQDHRYRPSDFSDTITGTVVNNAGSEISFVSVYAILYDSNDQVIDIATGTADVTTLPSGDNSAFSIDIYGESEIAKYTLLVGGRPSGL